MVGCGAPCVNGSTRWCRSHYNAYMRGYMRERNQTPQQEPCPGCGGEVWGRKRKYCSLECGRADAYRRRYQRANELIECPVCGDTFHRGHARRTYCGQRCSSKASSVQKLLGLPADEALSIYKRLVERAGGHCEMCGIPFERSGFRPPGTSGSALDHCHESGLARGLLCGACNASLGKYEKHRENAERYLAMSALDLRDLCLRA